MIAVAVVNYRSAHRIAQLLPTLVGSPVARVSIVDSGSPPDDVALLRTISEGYDWVSVDESPTNLGFGAGANRAVRNLHLAQGDAVWILNPDIEVYPGAAERLLATLSSSADIVSPLIVQGERESPVIYFCGGEIDWWRGRSAHWGEGEALSPGQCGSPLRDTKFITGAAPMMRFDTWELLGGFREDYFLYWEDADLSLRAQQMGLRCMVNTSAVVWHDGRGSASESGRHRAYYWHNARNRRRFLDEWQPVKPGVLRLCIRATETARLGVRALLEKNEPIAKFVAVLDGGFSQTPWDPVESRWLPWTSSMSISVVKRLSDAVASVIRFVASKL